ncbi:MAG: semialdehyde dehydrogenase [Flavobacteriales bacterium MED-G22]|nr:MAG: semialdehyde dehydrogenase [Flavobacteriales bacterium MED-G22]|tara:strand:+ start:1690 stop:2343 length:654 start_codon:yes stop_codon:yes gene_type:complete
MEKLNALVIGATGATGQELVSQLLEDESFNSVSIFVRNDPNITHSKLKTYIIDFSKIEDYKNSIKGDVLFSCLGTTLRDAGSKEKQYLVDLTYQFEFAKIASENGVPNYSLVSSTGANENSPFFYPKIKGKLEEAVKKLPFKTIQIFQPPTLIRQKDLIRTGEKIGIKIFGFLNYFGILKSQKPLAVSNLAKIMVEQLKKKQTEKVTTFNSFNKGNF